MQKANKYEILLGILFDNAYMSPMRDRLIFDDSKLSQDIRSFLMAFEPEEYNKRLEDLR